MASTASTTSTTDLAATAAQMAKSAERLREAREQVLGFARELHDMFEDVSGLSTEAQMDLERRCEGILFDLDDDESEAKPAKIPAQVDELVALIGFYTEQRAS